LRASSDVVVTGKVLVMPMPGSSFAGSSGCAPGGTTHISAFRARRLLALGEQVRRGSRGREDDEAAEVHVSWRQVYSERRGGQAGRANRFAGCSNGDTSSVRPEWDGVRRSGNRAALRACCGRRARPTGCSRVELRALEALLVDAQLPPIAVAA
jgi:hypothetical protein